jgi:hypothetical protein
MIKEIPKQIAIINSEIHGWTIIADGLICDKLQWDEMLGTLAALTLTGAHNYGWHPIGDPSEGNPWNKIPRQITQGEGVPAKPKGKVTTLDKLHRLSLQRKSVITLTGMFSHRPFPAAFVINLNGHTLHQLFKQGMYVYEKKNIVDIPF